MRLMRESRQVFGGMDIWRQSEWALALLSLVSSCFAISVVPFLRKDLGERYFGWLNLYFGYSVIAGFTFFGGLLNFFIRGPMMFPQLMGLFLLAFIGASIYQRREITRRKTMRALSGTRCTWAPRYFRCRSARKRSSSS